MSLGYISMEVVYIVCVWIAYFSILCYWYMGTKLAKNAMTYCNLLQSFEEHNKLALYEKHGLIIKVPGQSILKKYS